jgi:hypothetical protein
MSIPSPELPDPAAAAPPRRNPFGRHREIEKPAERAPEPPASAPTAHRGTTPDRKSTRREKPRSKRLSGSRDVLLSLPAELQERMESVIAYTYPHTGVRTQQAFIRAAIAQACADHEDRYNDGEPWPPIPKPQ